VSFKRGSTLTDTIESEASRRAFARRHGLTDLGRLPERIRNVARFWGGSNEGARALYELATTDGMVRSTEDLRSEMSRVHDLKVRDELLAWLKEHVQ
jgi:hypothetical protein